MMHFLWMTRAHRDNSMGVLPSREGNKEGNNFRSSHPTCSITSVLIDIYRVFDTLAWGVFHAIQVNSPTQPGYQETDHSRRGRVRPRYPAKLSAQACSERRSQKGRTGPLYFELIPRH